MFLFIKLPAEFDGALFDVAEGGSHDVVVFFAEVGLINLKGRVGAILFLW